MLLNDIVTLAKAGFSRDDILKMVTAQVPAAVPAQVPAAVPAQGPAQVPAQVTAQGPAQGPAQVPAQGPAQVTAQVPAAEGPTGEEMFNQLLGEFRGLRKDMQGFRVANDQITDNPETVEQILANIIAPTGGRSENK